MRALLSVSDKTGIEEFASGLTSRGYELISTGGTARTLRDAGLPITLVSEITGMPEMMDGRVKTLHPNIHAGILARRDHETDLSSLQEYDIEPIDLVVVNLYPFARTAANKSVSVSELIEQIDIGGPSLVRAAAKNFKDVLVIVDSGDYEATLLELDRSDGPELAFRLELSRKAFAHTAEYDTTIAHTFKSIAVSGTDFRREQSSPADVVPDRLTVDLPRISTLRYGENPHQEAAWYGDSKGIGLPAAHQVQGKPLSFTNLIDLDAAARVVLEFEEPAAAVIKHTNPCGVATSATITNAYRQARDADALSAFGGIVGLNRPLDSTTASEIVSTFIEAVVAPSITDAAKAVLGPAGDDYTRRYKYDIRPATDDRPYFFDFFRWRLLDELYALRGRGGFGLLEWGYLVLVLTLAQAVIITLALIPLPLLVVWNRHGGVVTTQKIPVLTYFLCLGLAFLFIEIAFI